MTDSQRVLAPLRFDTEVEPVNEWWVGKVYAVTPTTRILVFETVQRDEEVAHSDAYQFVRCQR